MRTEEQKQHVRDVVNEYKSKDHSYDDNINFIRRVLKEFPCSYHNLLRGKKFEKLWNDVVDKTHFLDEFYKANDTTRLYYYINKITSVIRCVTCGKPYVKKISAIENTDINYRFHCSISCMVKDPVIQANMQTTKEKNHTTTRDLLEKTKERNREKYGCDWYFQTDKFCEQKLAAWKESGYDHPMHSKDIRQKMQDNLERQYGKGITCNWQIPSCVEKVRKTNMERYGAPTPMESKEIHAKMHANSTDTKLRMYYNDVICKYKDVTPLFTEDDYVNNREQYFKFKWKCNSCNGEFECRMHSGAEPRCLNCKPLIYDVTTSQFEQDLFDYISSIALNYECKRGTTDNWAYIKSNPNDEHSSKQQLDILCINKVSGKVEFAFEADGVYWHSILMKPIGYHLNKTVQCEQQGIKLMHIWEDEWHGNQDVVKRQIKDFIDNDITFNSISDVINLPRDKFCKCVDVPGYHLISESNCNIVKREIDGDIYEVEDCGILTYKKND